MFMGGRFILGFGVAFVNVSGPVYSGEMAHPTWCGPLLGLYNCFWYIGAIVAAWVVYVANTMQNGWRIPIYCRLLRALSSSFSSSSCLNPLNGLSAKGGTNLHELSWLATMVKEIQITQL
ncbi:hypothetical protein DL95DRAFT_466827 [Leptodontidium sp. 2 PMI_412]|nr:hypothetical protein DL95DRAFT_466827 [Leptodontidium sp. 2 PMI_412]